MQRLRGKGEHRGREGVCKGFQQEGRLPSGKDRLEDRELHGR